MKRQAHLGALITLAIVLLLVPVSGAAASSQQVRIVDGDYSGPDYHNIRFYLRADPAYPDQYISGWFGSCYLYAFTSAATPALMTISANGAKGVHVTASLSPAANGEYTYGSQCTTDGWAYSVGDEGKVTIDLTLSPAVLYYSKTNSNLVIGKSTSPGVFSEQRWYSPSSATTGTACFYGYVNTCFGLSDGGDYEQIVDSTN